MKKSIISLLTICILMLTIPFMVFSHSGRTDSSGGHKDNKNKSGLGSYHYHCGGYPAHLHTNGVCPYKSGGSSSTSTSTKSSTKKVTPTYASKINAVNVPTIVNAGDTVTLEGKVYPSNAEDSTITWSSDDSTVVSVSSSGELKAVGVGTATISASTSRGTTSKFTITVNEVVAEKIVIENKKDNILIGDSISLKVVFNPENTTDKTIVWTSENDNIASVSTDGMVTGNAVGKTKITATNKNISDSFVIDVKPIPAEDIVITPQTTEYNTDSGSYQLEKGQQIQLSAEVLPENTTNKTVDWSVSDESIATIDENGLLTGIGTGSVVVIATTNDGIKSEFEVNVYSNTNAMAGAGVTAVAVGAGIALYLKKRKNKKQAA